MGAEEAEAFLSWSTGSSVDIEGGRISYPSQGSAAGISIRLLCKRKPGFAYCTHEDMIRSAVEKAIEISKIGKESAFHFPDKASYTRPPGTFDRKISSLTPDDSIRFLSEIIDAAREVAPGINVGGGGVDFGRAEAALVNSNGVAISDSGTMISAGAYVTLKDRTVSTGFDHSSSRTMAVDFAAIGKRAAQLAVDSKNPAATRTARRTVLFTPEAFSALLGSVTIPSLYGEVVGRGESVYTGKLGEQVAAPILTLSDDGLLPHGLGTSMSDDEGVPSQKTVLVEKGVLKAFLYDVHSAIKFGAATTGSAGRGSYRVPPETTSRNFLVEGRSHDAGHLISEIKDGLLVHEVLGAHTASSVSGDFSVSAPLLFQIKDGELGRPLKPVMLSGNIPVLLKGVSGIGKDRKHIGGYGGSIVTGSVRAENVMVTG
jgi:PmbA protein